MGEEISSNQTTLEANSFSTVPQGPHLQQRENQEVIPSKSIITGGQEEDRT